MSDARAKLALHSLYENVVRWVKIPQNRHLMLEVPRHELMDATLDDGSLMTDLRFLALWYGAVAVAGARDGTDSRAAIASAHLASLLEARAGVRSFRGDARRRKRFRLWRTSVALHGSRALACGWTTDALWLADLLTIEGESGLFNPEDSVVVRFFLGIAARWRKPHGDSTVDKLPSGYAELLRGWDSEPDGLSEALRMSCEARLVWAEDEKQVSATGSLGDLVYAVYPAELLAFLRLRRHHGLAPVVSDHPLLTMPMGALQDLAGERHQEPALDALISRQAV